ncbi:hypothetical protein [Polymorphobacter fuscus]|uniref:Uncharacterized protein n=1 Tax=Sandarakinorhabdus fusca TaxID=1439888 RepID=A0A7C9KV32_9SPHN|nr:hypothetical protein [Polymorphobacter fuscus]KAB7648427.1 hypothetical protein F9290_01540 [Polymorphobacter fuscus]MQT15945.1 hypothetical protein [Polymorphobacter fuscus]NJC07779.1 hypothetical protein [Polymorphobacter fuscus]
MTTLLGRPAHFLKYYPVKCAGSSAPVQNAANTKAYRIVKRDGALGQKAGHRGATRPGIFGTTLNISSFKLEPGGAAVGAGTVAQAHVVPMVNHNSTIYGCFDLQGVTNAMPNYVLDAGGDGLMVTGELSNCCFAWVQQGNDLWCTHVQPVGGITPGNLQTELSTTGSFAGLPGTALSTFGRNQYPGGRASIIGVREGGVWNLYAQKTDTSFDTLTESWRIHPGPAVRL